MIAEFDQREWLTVLVLVIPSCVFDVRNDDNRPIVGRYIFEGNECFHRRIDIPDRPKVILDLLGQASCDARQRRRWDIHALRNEGNMHRDCHIYLPARIDGTPAASRGWFPSG